MKTHVSLDFHFLVPSIVGVFIFAIVLPLLIRTAER